MGIYTAPFQLAYTVKGAKLDTNLALNPGTYHAVVQEWDNCGGGASTPVTITVPSGGMNVFSSLQDSVGWTGYALLPPWYGICNTCKPTGPEETWKMTQNVASPSMSGSGG